MRFAVALLLAVLLTASGPASAGPEGQPASRIERPWLRPPSLARADRSDAEAISADVAVRIAELQARRDAIRRKGPLAGVITGAVLTGVGLGLAELCLFAGLSDGSSAGLITSAVLGGTGLIVLGASAPVLAIRDGKRRAINREIRALERANAASRAPAWRLGFDVGERKAVHLTWRY